MPKILAFAGSNRTNSFNHQVLQIAVKGAEEAGAEVTLIRLSDFELPLFDEDLEAEQGPLENALKLIELFTQHDGLLLACPEYNSSITPLLKNTIDWVSRPTGQFPALAAYQNKVACLMSASPGGFGGLRGLVHVRAILGNIGVTVLPKQFALGHAATAFAEDGSLKDEKQQASVKSLGANLSEVLAKLNA